MGKKVLKIKTLLNSTLKGPTPTLQLHQLYHFLESGENYFYCPRYDLALNTEIKYSAGNLRHTAYARLIMRFASVEHPESREHKSGMFYSRASETIRIILIQVKSIINRSAQWRGLSIV